MNECTQAMHVITENRFGTTRWCNCGKVQSQAWERNQPWWRRLLRRWPK